MNKTLVLYGLAMALGVFVLHGLEIHYAVRVLSTETFVIALAVLFTSTGIWIGTHLGNRVEVSHFKQNAQAIETLGLTKKNSKYLSS